MRVVIKIGTSTLTYRSGCVNIRRIEALCRAISDMKNAGHEVVIVSSGAIGMGVGKLNLKERPADIAGKQAAAAVGQCELMYVYDTELSRYNHTVAQLLLTAPDFDCKERRANLVGTMTRLIDLGVIPIVHENDTIATEEIVFGDNDTLAARVAVSVEADLLVLLSDIDGLFTADPRSNSDAVLIEEVKEITDEIMALGGGAGSALGTGGMETKLRAARIVTEAGGDMIIMNGAYPEGLYSILDGKAIGTRFYGKDKA